MAAHVEPGAFTSYSRRRGAYSGHPYGGYRQLIPVVDWLADRGLVENHIAPADPSHGRQSVMRATPELLDTVTAENVREGIVAPTLRLHGRDGHVTPVRDDNETRAMARRLAEIQEAISSLDVVIANDCPNVRRDGPFLYFSKTSPEKERGAVVTPLRTKMFRVFNNDLDHGGRFYGPWWQGVPQRRRKDRDFLRIDGEPTAEPDFAALHPRLLYAAVGQPLHIGIGGRPDPDPYSVPGWPRRLCKVGLNTLLNATTPESAIRALTLEIGGKGAGKRAKSLCEALRARHEPISAFFGTGIGLRLQRLDSDLAESVLLRLIRRHGVAALPLHDGFRCRTKDRPKVEEAMNAAWRDVNLCELQSGRLEAA
jgi:hypothetical protein